VASFTAQLNAGNSNAIRVSGFNGGRGECFCFSFFSCDVANDHVLMPYRRARSFRYRCRQDFHPAFAEERGESRGAEGGREGRVMMVMIH